MKPKTVLVPSTLPRTLIPSTKNLRDTLCTALEGGSNFWYSIIGYDFSNPDICYSDFKADGKYQLVGDYHHPAQVIPTVDGCAMCIKDLYNDHAFGVWINPLALQYGFSLLPLSLAVDMASEDDDDGNPLDADGADYFLQMCVYGELVYG
jgi:hypothetical protein